MGFSWDSKCKIWKTVSQTNTGYVLEIYESDGKIDAQLYESVEDGRHIVTMDLPKKSQTCRFGKRGCVRIYI